MRLTSPATLMDFDPTTTRTNADSSHNMGELVWLSDDRAFRYAKAGASNISHGKLQKKPAASANYTNKAVNAAVAIGGKVVTFTPGASAATANEYAEGYLVVNDATGEGYSYKVSGHLANAGSVELSVNLTDPIRVALTTSSEVTLVHNFWNGVIEATGATTFAAGVPVVDVTAGDYAWLQTKGVASVLIGAAATAGAQLMGDASTAGAVTDNTDVTTVQTEIIVARASIAAGVSTEYNPVVLCID